MTGARFRHVDAEVSDPVGSWPAEAVEAALERGSLAEWARLARAVREQPWGPVARRLESVLGYARPYGVATLMDRAIARARAASDAADRAAVAAEIRDLLARSGLSRAAAASALGTSPPRLSTYATGRVTPSAAFLVALRRLANGGGDR